MTATAPFFADHQLALVGESPTGIRSAALLEGIDGLLRHCGLVPERYRPVRHDEAAAETLWVSGLEQTLAAVGVAGHVHARDGGPPGLTPEALAAALADPQVVELRTGGAGWALALPLRPGPLLGVSTTRDLPAHRLPELLSGMLEASQADWAMADAPAAVAAAFAGHSRQPAATEMPAPPLGAFNWRCVDWIADLGWQQADLPPGTTCARAFSGASVIQLDAANAQARAALSAALPALARPWSRPALQAWHADGAPARTVRPASPALLARQQCLAGMVGAHYGIAPGQRTLHHALAQHWAGSTGSPQRDEALSAFVGEAAVCRGGHWHRIMDPAIGFPYTLIVIFDEGRSFNPHAAIHAWRKGGANPFAVLEALLAGAPPTPD